MSYMEHTGCHQLNRVFGPLQNNNVVKSVCLCEITKIGFRV
jgi:hypothetical protein